MTSRTMMSPLQTLALARKRDFVSAFIGNAPIAAARLSSRRRHYGAIAREPLPPLHLFLACGPFALFNRDTILDHYPRRIGSWGSVMGLDTGTVFKRSVLCPHCNEEYLFTLRAIADNPELRCYGCGGTICLRDRIFEQLVSDVRNSLEAIAAAPPSFISARPRSAV